MKSNSKSVDRATYNNHGEKCENCGETIQFDKDHIIHKRSQGGIRYKLYFCGLDCISQFY